MQAKRLKFDKQNTTLYSYLVINFILEKVNYIHENPGRASFVKYVNV
jgi:hypothetical protein